MGGLAGYIRGRNKNRLGIHVRAQGVKRPEMRNMEKISSLWVDTKDWDAIGLGDDVRVYEFTLEFREH